MSGDSMAPLYALVAALFGILGGVLVIPINALVSYFLKRDELRYQNQLDIFAKKRELLLQHELEKTGSGQQAGEFRALRDEVRFLRDKIHNLEMQSLPEMKNMIYSLNEESRRFAIVLKNMVDQASGRK